MQLKFGVGSGEIGVELRTLVEAEPVSVEPVFEVPEVKEQSPRGVEDQIGRHLISSIKINRI